MTAKSNNPIKDKVAKFREYIDYFERHYDNVQKAWALINVLCQNKNFRFMSDDFVWHSIDSAIKMHDESKLSMQEFTQYRNYFFTADGEEKDKLSFDFAWEHHLDQNEHHWENWTTKKYLMYGDIFVVQMVCDWIAMGFEFDDNARDYYKKNKDKINLPEWAIKLIHQIFDCVYPESPNDGIGFSCCEERIDQDAENNMFKVHDNVKY